MRLFRILVGVTAALTMLGSSFVSSPAFAMSNEEKETTFWKVAVIDFAGKTPNTDGPTAGVRFAASLRNSKRFHVIDPRTVRSAVRSTGIDVTQGKLSDSDAKKVCKQLRVDGVFIGRIEKTDKGGALTIGLYSASSGRLFAQYRFPMTAQFPLAEAEKLAAGYTERLPYDGLVVSVRRDLALINLGTANGLGNGSKVFSFEFDGLQRTDAGGLSGGSRKALAELEVVRSEQHGAWVRPLRGDMPEEMTKISLRPVTGSEQLKPTAVLAASSATPYVSLETDADVAFLFKSYKLSGTGAQYTSNTTLFPAPGIHVLYYPTSALGGELRFRHGFIPFRRPVGAGPTAHIETYQGSIDQFELQGEARKVFSNGTFAGGSLTAGAGVSYTSFKIASQNPIVLSSDTYMGPILSGQLRLPLLDAITLRSGIGIMPFGTITQSPQDNGKGTVFGLHGTMGLDYHINDKLFLAFDYGLDNMQTKFPSSGGSRGIPNAKQSDLYHGVTLSLGWRSYR
jgi:hypothetical protein